MYFTLDFMKKLFRLGFLFVLILVLMDILTYFYYPNLKISEIFLATREQTPLTWVSTVVLLLIALSCATVYMKTKSKFWYLLSLVYLFFSMDDATYFHERFSAVLQESSPLLASFPSYSWVILYLPLLGFGLGGLLYTLWKKASKKEKRIIIIASLLLGISLLLDMVDGWVGKSKIIVFCLEPECSSVVEHLFRLTEESFEVFGFGLFAYLNLKKHTVISRVA